MLHFAVFFLVSAVMFNIDYRRNAFSQVKEYFSLPRYYLMQVIDLPFSVGINLSKYLVMNSTLLQENSKLKQLTVFQAIQLQKLDYLQLENANLKKLLHFTENQQEAYGLANIINVELDRFKHQVILDRGLSQGVFVGQPLVTDAGIVGSIIEVEQNYSTAILITDVSHAIPVVNLRNGLRAIAVGNGQVTTIDLQHISHTADIQSGDVFVTSGIGGKYPPGYLVGVVKNIKKQTNYPFATVSLQVNSDLDKCKQALLIYPNSSFKPAIGTVKTTENTEMLPS